MTNGGVEKNSPEAPDDIDKLLSLHSLYSTIHVDLESVYYNRTSIVTLTQGLLFVAYNGIIKQSGLWLGNLAIAILGALLAVLWLFFEQRNHAFFKGRAELLRRIEKRLLEKKVQGFQFFGLWSEVPQWVINNAKWYERMSAQKILRVWVPIMFAAVWSSLIGLSLFKSNNAHIAKQLDGTTFEKQFITDTLNAPKGQFEIVIRPTNPGRELGQGKK